MALKFPNYQEWKGVCEEFSPEVAGDMPVTDYFRERDRQNAMGPYDPDAPRLPGNFGGLVASGRRETWAERVDRARSAQTTARLARLGVRRRGR